MDTNSQYELFHKIVINGSSIKEHPLEKADENFKNTYYDLLYITAQYENSDTENQIHPSPFDSAGNMKKSFSY